MNQLKEILGSQDGMLFKSEMMSPVFCKPKLIPLKTVTMEKLEKMQKDAIEKLKALEESLKAAEAAPKPTSPAPDGTPQEPGQADVWSADD